MLWTSYQRFPTYSRTYLGRTYNKVPAVNTVNLRSPLLNDQCDNHAVLRDHQVKYRLDNESVIDYQDQMAGNDRMVIEQQLV